MRKIIATILLTSILTGAMFSCLRKDKYDDISLRDLESAWAFPLVKTTLTLKDLAENIDRSVINVHEDDQGLYIFYYRDTIRTEKAEDIFKIPYQHLQSEIKLDLPNSVALAAGTNVEVSMADALPFEFDKNEKIKYADLKNGDLEIRVSSSFKHRAELNITFTSLSKNGLPLKKNYTIDESGILPTRVTDNIDLQGYRLDLSNGNTTNTFALEASVRLISSGKPVLPADGLSIDLYISGLQYKVLFGNVGRYEFAQRASEIDINIFDDALEGDIYFEDPRLKLTLANSFGVPSGFTVDRLAAITNRGLEIPVTAPFVPGPNELDFPSANEIGRKKLTMFEMNRSNSNVVQAFNPAPPRLEYHVRPYVGNDELKDYFILDESRIELYAEAEIPMHGRISVYALADTIPLELPARELVEYVKFKIRTENLVPVNVNLQGLWLDEYNKVLDTLILPANDLVRSGTLNGNGEVTAPAIQQIEIVYDTVRYDKLTNVRKLVLLGNLITPNNGQTSVKFFSHQYLKVQIAAEVKARQKF